MTLLRDVADPAQWHTSWIGDGARWPVLVIRGLWLVFYLLPYILLADRAASHPVDPPCTWARGPAHAPPPDARARRGYLPSRHSRASLLDWHGSPCAHIVADSRVCADDLGTMKEHESKSSWDLWRNWSNHGVEKGFGHRPRARRPKGVVTAERDVDRPNGSRRNQFAI